jgi:hypothetical protein
LLATLRTTLTDRKGWDEVLQAAAHAYNDSIHSVLGYAPFELLHGQRSRLPWHLQLPSLDPNVTGATVLSTLDARVQNFMDAQARVYQQVKQILLKAAEAMEATHAAEDRTFRVGDLVKIQFGLKSSTDKDKLDPYWAGPFKIIEDLSHGAYRIELPPECRFDDRINVSRLARWYDSDLSLFPQAIPTDPILPDLPLEAEPTYRILRYLIRDFSRFPAHAVQYYVEADLQSAADRYFFIDETADLLDDILAFEAHNGCLPERGIHPANRARVTRHKELVYLVTPCPILQNTWHWALPYSTRRPPRVKLKLKVGSVVQQLFFLDDETPQYFQGVVTTMDESAQKCTIQFTDGGVAHHTLDSAGSMLYDPIRAVYDGSATCAGNRESVADPGPTPLAAP